MPNESVHVGLISGTSLDGIDAVAVDFNGAQPNLLACHSEPYPTALQTELRAISVAGENEIDRLGELDRQVAARFADACLSVLDKGGLRPEQVAAIGCHGQTIRHRPEAVFPFTLQIGDPNTLSELTGITTVADFRRRDMAAGGQGAPLAPAFHQALFQHPEQQRVVLNLGGIANITCLPCATGKQVIGYDTGPANTLLDRWIERYQAVSHDHCGEWARSGRIEDDLLRRLLSDPYFNLPPPKSTGPEYFNLDWLGDKLSHSNYSPTDVQATLVELTTAGIAQAIGREGFSRGEVLVCGGGVHNTYLMERLGFHLPECAVRPTSVYGVDPDLVEAMTFAWLAKRTLAGLSGNLPSVTGATRDVILGGIYPASRLAEPVTPH
ncbi:MAG: anhydro-N-acetylmuramic acid kinase [Candidatus Thiodiazotropha sp. (ex Dulcina madagascariensis)]|nr:anhydro-N-acetylmuramic acid kinase [Candidatus Thiodiazotropha sp. (ex Dulcina madagascariensis)]